MRGFPCIVWIFVPSAASRAILGATCGKKPNFLYAEAEAKFDCGKNFKDRGYRCSNGIIKFSVYQSHQHALARATVKNLIEALNGNNKETNTQTLFQ